MGRSTGWLALGGWVGCVAHASSEPPAEVMARIEAAADDVRAHRGELEIPTVRLGSSDTMIELARREMEVRLDEQTKAYTDCSAVAWGLAKPGTRVIELLAPLFTDAAGVYVAEDDAIYVNTDEKMREQLDVTLRHELVHARQDQVGTIFDTDPHTVLSDVSDVVRLLAEGDATASTMAIVMGQAGLERDPVEVGMAPPRMAQETPLMAFLFDTLLQPYAVGGRLMQRVAREGGWHAVDELLRNPPLSAEQLLDATREAPWYVDLDASDELDADWRVFPADTIGLLSMDALYWSWFDGKGQGRVLNGWAGDRMQCVLPPSGEAGFVWRTRWDTVEDATRFEDLSFRWTIRGIAVRVERRGLEVLLTSAIPAARLEAVVAAAWKRPFRKVRSVRKRSRYDR